MNICTSLVYKGTLSGPDPPDNCLIDDFPEINSNDCSLGRHVICEGDTNVDRLLLVFVPTKHTHQIYFLHDPF